MYKIPHTSIYVLSGKKPLTALLDSSDFRLLTKLLCSLSGSGHGAKSTIVRVPTSLPRRQAGAFDITPSDSALGPHSSALRDHVWTHRISTFYLIFTTG